MADLEDSMRFFSVMLRKLGIYTVHISISKTTAKGRIFTERFLNPTPDGGLLFTDVCVLNGRCKVAAGTPLVITMRLWSRKLNY